MNVLKLLTADQSALSVPQQSLQRALRSFLITLLSSLLVEIGVILVQRPDLSWYSFYLLLAGTLVSTGGHALEPILLSLGVDATVAQEIEKDVEILGNSVSELAQEQEKKNHAG